MNRNIDKLEHQSQILLEKLKSCDLCPRNCKVNRLEGEKGVCNAGKLLKVSSCNLHHGEEPPISGTKGSGTIFLSYCTLKCLFCQNWPISHLGNGKEMTSEELAFKMLHLQKLGAHNINFVTPTQYYPQISEALLIAFKKGLTIPILFNNNGYDTIETLKLLDGFVDIYMPDIKYTEYEIAKTYSKAPNYFEINKVALLEMQRQVGQLQMDDNGIAQKGLLVRHLIMPNAIKNSKAALKFLADNIPDTYISLMSQYFPAYEAEKHEDISRKITSEEYYEVSDYMEELSLENGWKQDI